MESTPTPAAPALQVLQLEIINVNGLCKRLDDRVTRLEDRQQELFQDRARAQEFRVHIEDTLTSVDQRLKDLNTAISGRMIAAYGLGLVTIVVQVYALIRPH